MKSIPYTPFFPAAILCRVCFCLILFFPQNAICKEKNSTSDKIVAGVIEASPVYIKTDKGDWEGLGVEIWRAIARQMGVSFEFREYDEFGVLLDALENGEIDAIPCLPAELRYEVAMDLSQSYYKSGLAIAVPAEGDDYGWTRVVAKFFSTGVLKAVGLLFLLCLVAGTIVCFFERQGKRDVSGEEGIQGIGQGVWWSIVTMTTVGYGDKTPKTAGGRVAATLWMLFSIVFIASFTANITASLTVDELQGKVHDCNDLYNARVGSIARSEASDFLSRSGIASIPFQNIKNGLKALEDKEIDAFVLNEIVLKYLVKTEFPGSVKVLPGTFDEYFVAVALKGESTLREPVNQALLKLMETEQWRELLNRYVQ